jgi:hypothetical protein
VQRCACEVAPAGGTAARKGSGRVHTKSYGACLARALCSGESAVSSMMSPRTNCRWPAAAKLAKTKAKALASLYVPPSPPVATCTSDPRRSTTATQCATCIRTTRQPHKQYERAACDLSHSGADQHKSPGVRCRRFRWEHTRQRGWARARTFAWPVLTHSACERAARRSRRAAVLLRAKLRSDVWGRAVTGDAGRCERAHVHGAD